MTGDEFQRTLDRLGIFQADLAREIEALTGHRIDKTTTYRWAHGKSPIPAGVVAYLKMREMYGPPPSA